MYITCMYSKKMFYTKDNLYKWKKYKEKQKRKEKTDKLYWHAQYLILSNFNRR